ncbi:hypothetical protein ML462_15415 [Gramella lutea]|uniref:Lipoprotein n=1 Tax=Christiangramia lutea TaxID=1607951 RepID=A0A9X2ABU9_9FLAO|nr:hypothetical protein [Christiangramia lutea]MCH4824561.1 hypothetical protein [Christiangramia lutea]
MRIVSFFLLVVIFLSCNKEEEEKRIKYHEIEITASSINLLEKNITNKDNRSYVKEFIDSIGRTKRLEFYNSRGQLDYPGSGYYGGPIIKYHYEPNSITETAYTSDIDLANDFQTSEVPNQIIYYLNDKNEIDRTVFRYKIEFNMEKDQLDEIINNLKLYKDLIPNSGLETREMDSIFGYQFATARLHGINFIKPKSN